MKNKILDILIEAIEENPKLAESLPDKIITFDLSDKKLSKIFTPKRLELLNIILQKNPRNISELSRQTKRKIENVYRDLKQLEKYGLITLEKHGRDTEPQVRRAAIVLALP